MRCRVWREEESSVGTVPMDIKTQAGGFRGIGEIVFIERGFSQAKRDKKRKGGFQKGLPADGLGGADLERYRTKGEVEEEGAAGLADLEEQTKHLKPSKLGSRGDAPGMFIVNRALTPFGYYST